MDFPIEILFPSKEPDVPGAVRVKVAAICAMLDHGSFDGTEFSEADISPFHGDEYVSSFDGTRHGTFLRGHTFINIKPKGHLAVAVEKLISAMSDSIKANQLETVVSRFTLNGDIDAANTWLRMRAAADWLQSRNIDTGDMFDSLWDDEEKVFGAAVDAANEVRLKLETPDVEVEMKGIQGQSDWDQSTTDAFNKILRENFALRAGAPNHSNADRPVSARERKTLLTIIAVLARAAKVPLDDYGKPGKAAGYIEGLSDEFGAHVSKRTIDELLKRIPDALETRMK